MHPDQVTIDARTAGALIDEQFPHLGLGPRAARFPDHERHLPRRRGGRRWWFPLRDLADAAEQLATEQAGGLSFADAVVLPRHLDPSGLVDRPRVPERAASRRGSWHRRRPTSPRPSRRAS